MVANIRTRVSSLWSLMNHLQQILGRVEAVRSYRAWKLLCATGAQQAVHHYRSAQGGGAGGVAQSGKSLRRAGGELPAWCDGKVAAWAPGACKPCSALSFFLAAQGRSYIWLTPVAGCLSLIHLDRYSRCLVGQRAGSACPTASRTLWQDLKPELIYTRISGYGQTGPKASLAGYASVCEAYGGLRHLNGYTSTICGKKGARRALPLLAF